MKANKTMCSGCRDNFYNGNNELGVQECWAFKTAKVVKKVEIHIDAIPPYKGAKPRNVLSCFHRSRFIQVNPEFIGKDGFLK